MGSNICCACSNTAVDEPSSSLIAPRPSVVANHVKSRPEFADTLEKLKQCETKWTLDMGDIQSDFETLTQRLEELKSDERMTDHVTENSTSVYILKKQALQNNMLTFADESAELHKVIFKSPFFKHDEVKEALNYQKVVLFFLLFHGSDHPESKERFLFELLEQKPAMLIEDDGCIRKDDQHVKEIVKDIAKLACSLSFQMLFLDKDIEEFSEPEQELQKLLVETDQSDFVDYLIRNFIFGGQLKDRQNKQQFQEQLRQQQGLLLSVEMIRNHFIYFEHQRDKAQSENEGPEDGQTPQPVALRSEDSGLIQGNFQNPSPAYNSKESGRRSARMTGQFRMAVTESRRTQQSQQSQQSKEVEPVNAPSFELPDISVISGPKQEMQLDISVQNLDTSVQNLDISRSNETKDDIRASKPSQSAQKDSEPSNMESIQRESMPEKAATAAKQPEPLNQSVQVAQAKRTSFQLAKDPSHAKALSLDLKVEKIENKSEHGAVSSDIVNETNSVKSLFKQTIEELKSQSHRNKENFSNFDVRKSQKSGGTQSHQQQPQRNVSQPFNTHRTSQEEQKVTDDNQSRAAGSQAGYRNSHDVSLSSHEISTQQDKVESDSANANPSTDSPSQSDNRNSNQGSFRGEGSLGHQTADFLSAEQSGQRPNHLQIAQEEEKKSQANKPRSTFGGTSRAFVERQSSPQISINEEEDLTPEEQKFRQIIYHTCKEINAEMQLSKDQNQNMIMNKDRYSKLLTERNRRFSDNFELLKRTKEQDRKKNGLWGPTTTIQLMRYPMEVQEIIRMLRMLKIREFKQFLSGDLGLIDDAKTILDVYLKLLDQMNRDQSRIDPFTFSSPEVNCKTTFYMHSEMFDKWVQQQAISKTRSNQEQQRILEQLSKKTQLVILYMPRENEMNSLDSETRVGKLGLNPMEYTPFLAVIDLEGRNSKLCYSHTDHYKAQFDGASPDEEGPVAKLAKEFCAFGQEIFVKNKCSKNAATVGDQRFSEPIQWEHITFDSSNWKESMVTISYIAECATQGHPFDSQSVMKVNTEEQRQKIVDMFIQILKLQE